MHSPHSCCIKFLVNSRINTQVKLILKCNKKLMQLFTYPWKCDMVFGMKEFSPTDITTIGLMYETYGYDATYIGAMMSLPQSIVRMAIEEHSMVRANKPARKEEVSLQNTVQELELRKQMSLLPHYARAEALILGRIIEGVNNVDSADPMSHMAMSAYARAMKDLKSATQTMSLGETDSGGVVVQILNQIS